MGAGSNKETPAGYGRAGHCHLSQRVRTHDIKIVVGIDDIGITLFTEHENLPVIGPG